MSFGSNTFGRSKWGVCPDSSTTKSSAPSGPAIRSLSEKGIVLSCRPQTRSAGFPSRPTAA